MDEIILSSSNLPSNIEDLSRFVLVAREKIVSVKAEIRAIEKLELAKKVRDEKVEECRLLSEVLLDAETKLGEFFKQLPILPKEENLKKKAEEDWDDDEWEQDFNMEFAHIPYKLRMKGKYLAVKELGFNLNQKEQFETMAENVDLVEEVKAEARKNQSIPTRKRILDLAKERKLNDEKEKQEILTDKSFDLRDELFEKFTRALLEITELNPDKKYMNRWINGLDTNSIEEYTALVTKSMTILVKFKAVLLEIKSSLK